MDLTEAKLDALKREELRYAAMLAGDVAYLSEVFADDSIYTHSTGSADDKQGYLSALLSGAVIYRSIDRIEETVNMVDDAAIISGRIRLTVDVRRTRRTLESRFLSVWVKRGFRWQYVAWQSTPIKS